MEKKIGFVSFIGAGPGDPKLITVKGLEVLKNAEVICYDALLDTKFLDYFPKNCLVIYVGKRCGKHIYTQTEINQLLVQHALEGSRVVRLKGGDPSLFGRLTEEIDALKENQIHFEIIPGVSSVFSGSSVAKFPLTSRNLSNKLLILDGHHLEKDENYWKWLQHFNGTIVILMGMENIQEIGKKMFNSGWDKNTKFAIIENASMRDEIVTMYNLKNLISEKNIRKTSGPGIIYIGDVVQNSSSILGIHNQIIETIL